MLFLAWLPLALLAGAVCAASAAADVGPLEVREYRNDFDVSAQQAEETLETQASGAEQDIVGQLEDGLGSRYAGLWFDNQAGEFVVPVLGSASRADTRGEFAEADLVGEYRTAPAQSSWAELESAQEQLNQTLAQPMRESYIETSIDPRTNSVVIQTSEGIEPAAEQEARALASNAGVSVEVREKGAKKFTPVPAACGFEGVMASGFNCDAPFRGGVGIGKHGWTTECSAAFKATGLATGNRFVLTAGHCVDPYIKEWDAYDHNGNGQYLGVTEQAFWGTGGHDLAKIRVNGSKYWDISPWPTQVIEWSGATDTMINSARSITAESNSYVGEQACLTGTTTGTSCGFVTEMGKSVGGTFQGTAYVVNHLSKLSSVCNATGNSGGPVFTGNTALGITSFADGELPECSNYDLYSEITEDTDYLGVTVAPRVVSSPPPPKPKYADELGFVRFSKSPANTHLDTYIAGPTYKTLASNSDTGYPAITDPQNVQAIKIDTNGDGVDELAFVRLNTASGNAHIDIYGGFPNYKTLIASSDTGYPAVSDPQNIQVIAIDWNGDGIDELGFVRMNTASGNAHLDTYTGFPSYKTLASNSDTGYPAVSDPQNVQAMAIDWTGDGIDELGFVRMNTASGKAHLDSYVGAPNYQVLASNSDTGYPAVSDPQNVQAMSMDWNGDGTDELGFVRLNTFSGNAHLDSYTGAPNYQTLASNSDVGYPAVSDPENIQALALNTTTDPYQAPGAWGYDNLGGTLTSDPDISSWGGGRLDVFAKGTDNALWHKAYSSPNWFGWEKIGGTLTSGPGAVSWGSGRIDMVARTTGNTVQHWWFDNSVGVWNTDNLGGAIGSDPELSSWGPGRLDVFAKSSTSGTLNHRAFSSTAWFPWDTLPGTVASGAGAVSWGSGRIDIVARTASNTVQHWWFDASVGVWNVDNLGGNIASDPDISSWGPGRLDVFAKGAQNNLVHKYYANGAWSNWESLGGILASGPAAVSWASKRIDVVARATDNSIQHWYYAEP
jgi:16S rRNA C1402 (ribose-2'-O) methylase RsmI